MSEVRAAVLGQRSRLRRSEAFAVFAPIESSDRVSVLTEVLTSERERLTVRRLAAIALGRTDSVDAQQPLIKVLDNAGQYPSLAADALRALGRVGTPDALPAIDSLLAGDNEGLILEAARFGGALIAHRFRIRDDSHSLAVPDALEPVHLEEMTPLRILTPAATDAENIKESLGATPYGAFLSVRTMTPLECQGSRYTICLDERFAAAGNAQTLAVEPAFLGTIALYSDENGRHSVCYTLLTQPTSDRRARLIAPHCSGRDGLVGEIRFERDEMRFRLAATDRPGAVPVLLEGVADERGLRFTQARSGIQPLNRLAPELLEEPILRRTLRP
jgi:hypothetical protein